MAWKMRPVKLCDNEDEVQQMINRVLAKISKERDLSTLDSEAYTRLRSEIEEKVREQGEMVVYYRASMDMD